MLYVGYKVYKAYGTKIHVFEFNPNEERFAYEYGTWNKLENLNTIPKPKDGETTSCIINWNFFDWTGKNNNGYGEIEQEGKQLQKPSVNFPSFSFKDNKLQLGDLLNAQIGASYGLTLVINSKIDIRNTAIVKATNKDARTAIGQLKNNNIVFVVAEGNDLKNVGVTSKELAEFMLNLGCHIAFMGDCGGSSSMMVNGNYAYKNEGRKVACCFVAYKKKVKPIKTMKVKVNTSLNIRQSPSLSGKIIGSYTNNTVVNIYEEKDGWCRTDKGWVSKQYLV